MNRAQRHLLFLSRRILSSTVNVELAGIAWACPSALQHNSRRFYQSNTQSAHEKPRPWLVFATGGALLGLAAIYRLNASHSVDTGTRSNVVEAITQFRSFLEESQISTNANDLKAHSEDVSPYMPEGRPAVVVFPASEEEVVRVLKACNALNVPVVAYGSGTSLEGQTVAGARSGVVVDLSRMDEIVEMYPEDMQAVVQPGISWNDLNHELQQYKLFFAPDPGLGASIGGMCATSCSGTRAYRYGVMRDNVIGLRVVLPDGRVVRTRRRPQKSSAGYDLTRLFIGSEGTLGIITEATIKLRNLPDNLSVALVTFDDVLAAAAMDLFRSGILLHRLELMDKTAMTAANVYNKTDLPNDNMLLVEFSGTPSTVAEHSSIVQKFAIKNGASVYRLAKDQAEYESIWALRRNALWSAALHRPDVDPKDISILNTDTVVPPSRLVEALTKTQELKREFGLEFQIVAHVGDGNYHCNVPLKKGDKAELERAKGFSEKLAKLAIDFDGSCTGEHGIGIGKRKFLELEVGKEAVEVMREIKTLFDPNNIMNPDHLLPPAHQ
ncbi:FAD-binding domain-containing protein [Gonapodya prolifera JEL478]|uniref:D-lactate dehydrogenase (cytochrome) n=1 Tax=Gonapodya prolifera (strain JEL478) TaxID=1344416 RepID=A0A139AK06_GONPJ|nr:FAD-binding domain-containing protein [Gonapodya prolifera JEL478]|eukprot:KXS17116.1 FAD-binding domain-containing protein [Gonapodya prolifera JEL478]